MKTLVRDRLTRVVFEIDPDTLEPLNTSRYDPFCYSHPDWDTIYMELYDWEAKLFERLYD